MRFSNAEPQDLRDPSVAQSFSTSNSEVRDVQFHPYFSNYFASANDNGTIQVSWDNSIRIIH